MENRWKMKIEDRERETETETEREKTTAGARRDHRRSPGIESPHAVSGLARPPLSKGPTDT